MSKQKFVQGNEYQQIEELQNEAKKINQSIGQIENKTKEIDGLEAKVRNNESRIVTNYTALKANLYLINESITKLNNKIEAGSPNSEYFNFFSNYVFAPTYTPNSLILKTVKNEELFNIKTVDTTTSSDFDSLFSSNSSKSLKVEGEFLTFYPTKIDSKYLNNPNDLNDSSLMQGLAIQFSQQTFVYIDKIGEFFNCNKNQLYLISLDKIITNYSYVPSQIKFSIFDPSYKPPQFNGFYQKAEPAKPQSFLTTFYPYSIKKYNDIELKQHYVVH